MVCCFLSCHWSVFARFLCPGDMVPGEVEQISHEVLSLVLRNLVEQSSGSETANHCAPLHRYEQIRSGLPLRFLSMLVLRRMCDSLLLYQALLEARVHAEARVHTARRPPFCARRGKQVNGVGYAVLGANESLVNRKGGTVDG